MSDCSNSSMAPYDVCRLRIEFECEETPWMYPLALNGRTIKGVFVNGERYERVRVCENLGKRYSGTWFICSKCGAESANGTYSERWMHQDHTDEECTEYNGEAFSYCPNCGRKVVSA